MSAVLTSGQITKIVGSVGDSYILELLHVQLIDSAQPIVEGFIANEVREGGDRDTVINNVTGDIFHYARRKIGFLVDVLANVPGYKQKVKDFVTPFYDQYIADTSAKAPTESGATVAEPINEGA